MRHRFSLAIFTVCALGGSAISASGQAGTTREVERHPVLDSATRERILDLAFPRPMNSSPGKREFSVLLRFLPSFHPESQIELRITSDWRGFVDYQRATVQAQEALAEFGDEQPIDLARVALQMRVVRTSMFLAPNSTKNIIKSFWSSISRSANTLSQRAVQHSVQLDGTLYTIAYDRGPGLEQLSFRFEDSELDTSSVPELPIVAWMIDLRHRSEHESPFSTAVP